MNFSQMKDDLRIQVKHFQCVTGDLVRESENEP